MVLGLTLTQSKIIIALHDADSRSKNASYVSFFLKLHIQYVYQELRQLVRFGFIEEKKVGRTKLYVPLDNSVIIAEKKILTMVKKKQQKNRK